MKLITILTFTLLSLNTYSQDEKVYSASSSWKTFDAPWSKITKLGMKRSVELEALEKCLEDEDTHSCKVLQSRIYDCKNVDIANNKRLVMLGLSPVPGVCSAKALAQGIYKL